MGRLMRDFYYANKDMFYSVLVEQSSYYMIIDEGVSDMCKIVDDIVKKYTGDIVKKNTEKIAMKYMEKMVKEYADKMDKKHVEGIVWITANAIAKVIAEDVAKEMIETVVRMLREKMSVDDISEIMDFSVDEIERIREEYCA